MDYPYINRTDVLMANSDGYAVYYPNDGFLGGVYSRDAAEAARVNLLDEFPDAYVVRVLIERVEA